MQQREQKVNQNDTAQKPFAQFIVIKRDYSEAAQIPIHSQCTEYSQPWLRRAHAFVIQKIKACRRRIRNPEHRVYVFEAMDKECFCILIGVHQPRTGQHEEQAHANAAQIHLAVNIKIGNQTILRIQKRTVVSANRCIEMNDGYTKAGK